MFGDRIGDEPTSNRIHVPVAIFALLMREEPLRHDHVQMILGARHRDIKQSPFLFDLGRATGREIGE
jgi:hypothetical protein